MPSFWHILEIRAIHGVRCSAHVGGGRPLTSSFASSVGFEACSFWVSGWRVVLGTASRLPWRGRFDGIRSFDGILPCVTRCLSASREFARHNRRARCLGNRFCVEVLAENVHIKRVSLEKSQVAFGQIKSMLTFWLETATQIGFCWQTLTQTGFRRRNLDTKRVISKKPWVARREIGSVHAFGLKTST